MIGDVRGRRGDGAGVDFAKGVPLRKLGSDDASEEETAEVFVMCNGPGL